MAVKTRAPTEPADTREEPFVGGADVEAGGAVALAEVELAGTLTLALEVMVELDTGALPLLLGAGAEVTGAEVAGTDGAGAEGTEGEAAVVVAGGAGALPGGVT